MSKDYRRCSQPWRHRGLNVILLRDFYLLASWQTGARITMWKIYSVTKSTRRGLIRVMLELAVIT